jgi:hypothetical protein
VATLSATGFESLAGARRCAALKIKHQIKGPAAAAALRRISGARRRQGALATDDTSLVGPTVSINPVHHEVTVALIDKVPQAHDEGGGENDRFHGRCAVQIANEHKQSGDPCMRLYASDQP